MLPADPLARSRRRAIVAVAVAVVLVLGVALTKLVSMQVAFTLGDRAWRAGDAVAAERYFAVAGSFNVVERWIARFDRGVAAYSQREWEDAADWYEAALEVAPESAHCRISLNLSWTLEAAGDEFAAADNLTEATVRWNAAQHVLRQAVDCDETSSTRRPTEPNPEEGEENTDGKPPQQQSAEESDAARPERDEVEQTERRLDRKQGNRPLPRKPTSDDQQPGAQAERLAERNRDAARAQRQQQQEQRQSTGGQDSAPDAQTPDGSQQGW